MDMRRSLLLSGVAAVGLMFAAGGARAYTAKPIYFKGYAAGSVTSTPFIFKVGPDLLTTEIGFDSLGGQNFRQTVTEAYDTGDTCTATDQTLGEQFDTYESLAVTTYFNGGQIDAFSDQGTTCVSVTTGVANSSTSYVVFDGTGRFAGASGTLENYGAGRFIAPPSEGFFASWQSSYSGTVTP
jgi:hypothetical protein